MTENFIEITVLFFGACREIAGNTETLVKLPVNSTVGDAFKELKILYPGLEKFGERLLFAVNENYANKEQNLAPSDKLAVFPPVSGGEDEKKDICELTRQEINSRELALQIINSTDGAVITFDGITRDNNKGRKVLFLEYEAYESMAIKMMYEIAQEAHSRWAIDRVAILHRLGRVDVSFTSVAIVVTSAHRKVAFEACHFLIDRLKEIVPIWKREYFEDGAIWVDPQMQ